MDIKQIENLLEKAEIIKNKYDDLAEYTGENFNVFNILRLDEKELMHSAFIANLLNVKGDHKQKDIFLKLFIDEIKGSFLENEENRKSLEKFDTLNSSAQEEEYIGKVDYESGEGGRIDIVVKDGNNVILIENKIGAGDQEAQLCRYYNYYTDSSIIYLTPYGSEPSESSKGHLENNKDFICISYKQHIVNWIENCIKEMANKPIIRETLNQYLHLVKQITNQTTNNKMEKELEQLIIKNKDAVKTLLDAHNSLENEVINKVNELNNLLRSAEYQLKLQEITKDFPEINFDVRKPWNEYGVRIFNSVFSKDNNSNEVFCLEIHNDENMEFSIDTGIWGIKNYKNVIEEIFEGSNYPISKSYERTAPNTEILDDVLIRLSFVIKSLNGKFKQTLPKF